MRNLLPYALPFLLFGGVAASSCGEQPGIERVLTNAHVAILIPSHTADVTEGRVASIGIDDMAPPGTTFLSGGAYRDYKIHCDITVESEQEFQHYAQRWKEDEDFQEHPHLTMYDTPIGKQLKKDIRDTERGVILCIDVTVESTNAFRQSETGTFQQDIETAKKMVESIRLLRVQPDETDIFNPLTMAEVETAKGEIEHLQPYMRPDDCIAALGIRKREVDTSVWGREGLIKNQGGIIPEQGIATSDWKPDERRRIFMMLRRGHVLLLICDGRGYVVAAQLDDKKWEWKRKPEPSNNALEPSATAPSDSTKP